MDDLTNCECEVTELFTGATPTAPAGAQVEPESEAVVMFPKVGAVPVRLANDPGIRALERMAQSIQVIGKIACYDQMAMFEVRDALATQPPALSQGAAGSDQIDALWDRDFAHLVKSAVHDGEVGALAKSFARAVSQGAAGAEGVTDAQIDAQLPAGRAKPGFDNYGCYTRNDVRKAVRAVLSLQHGEDAADAARWRRLVNASEMAFPVAAIADDPENDHTMLYGRKRLEDFIDRCDEIPDTYASIAAAKDGEPKP